MKIKQNFNFFIPRYHTCDFSNKTIDFKQHLKSTNYANNKFKIAASPKFVGKLSLISESRCSGSQHLVNLHQPLVLKMKGNASRVITES